MPATDMVHVRVDETVKREAAEALAAMGLSVSAAIRIFLARVAAEKALPFELRVPNAATQEAVREADEMIRKGRPRFSRGQDLMDELEKDGER